MSDPAGPVQFSLGDLGGPFGKFSDHSERWTKRTTKTAWSNREAQSSGLGWVHEGRRRFFFGPFGMLHRHANSAPAASYIAREMSVCGSAGRYVLGSWATSTRTGPSGGVVGLPETALRVPLSGKSIWDFGPPCREFCGQKCA